MARCIVMFSGGLDSTIAVHLLKSQGLEVTALHFVLPFASGLGFSHRRPRDAARRLGVPLRIEEEGEEFLAMIKSPAFGFGKNANPCLDCRIYRLTKARSIMHEMDASFIATGEVVGQRPMSQRMDCLYTIAKRSGLGGQLLRPLSAKLLRPTIPEQDGVVDRERLLSISGRGRKDQLAYAQEHRLVFDSPGGGCILTNERTADRFADLHEHNPSFDLRDFKLIAYGRHFRLGTAVKLIVGREEHENHALQKLTREGDAVLLMADSVGPYSLLCGPATGEHRATAASIAVRFSKEKDRPLARVRVLDAGRESIIEAAPAPDDLCDSLRV